MKPIVFISSVSEGYQSIRHAAREAVQKAGGQPIGFEDLHALDKASRNACLDGVIGCDVYLGIFGARYGFITPSDRSATEEEFDEAVKLGKRRLIFVEEVVDCEPKQQAFLNRVGDYKTGRFWKKFETIDDLRTNIETSLKEVFLSFMNELPKSQLNERLQKEVLEPLHNDYGQSWLIIAAMPDCQASLIDDSSFNDEKLAKQGFRIGQEGDLPVFEIELAKSKDLKENHWLLEQTEKQNWHNGLQLSIVKLYLDACVTVAMNVTGRELEAEDHLSRSLYIYPNFVEKIASAQLSFLSRLYDHFDPHFRWDRIALMTALHNIEYRNFSKPKPGQSSHPMSMRSDKGPFLAFKTPKILERNQLKQPDYGRALRASFERILK